MYVDTLLVHYCRANLLLTQALHCQQTAVTLTLVRGEGTGMTISGNSGNEEERNEQTNKSTNTQRPMG